MFHNIANAFSDILSAGDRRASDADSKHCTVGGSNAHLNMFPAPIFASSAPFFFGDTTTLSSRPDFGALQAGDATKQYSSPTGVFTPTPDFPQQPSGSFVPISSASHHASTPFPYFLPSGNFYPISYASHQASTSTAQFTQPFSVTEITEAPPQSDAFDLEWLTQLLQFPPPVDPQDAVMKSLGQTSSLPAPSLQFYSSSNNEVYNPSSSGPSVATRGSPSSKGPSNSVPCTPGSELLYPSPEPEVDTDRSVADNEGLGSPSLSHPPAGPIRRPRSQTARDPLYSTGRYKCRYHGCPWRFRNARMCNRHEQTHNEANAYFCCNPRCSTNTGKRKAGFPRRDSIRRHYAKKSPDDPCLVMARSLGWTGELIYEEEMFTVPPIPAFES